MELMNYIQKPDAAYRWEKVNETADGDMTVKDYGLVSQVWQGITWEHHLQVFQAWNGAHLDTVVLFVTGLDASAEEDSIGRAIAQFTGTTCAFLYQIPNQPLFDGLGEDALIAYTFSQYLDTEDADWPLLFPMVKSAVRAMDTIQAAFAQEGRISAPRFIVSGASKRGWTTWLSAVADTRIEAIVPMVYDNLNIPAQMPHQVEMWGDYSSQISDYTEMDLPQKMQTERGQRLAAMVDPYTYRDRLTMPKLIMNGANDAYWATDALNLYWDDLQGPKWVLYVPNAGHGLNDTARVSQTFFAFTLAIAEGKSLPALSWEFAETGNALQLSLKSDAPAVAARCWTAYSINKDFRPSAWIASSLQSQGAGTAATQFVDEVPLPRSGSMAVFGEIEFARENFTYTLSTQPYIFSAL